MPIRSKHRKTFRIKLLVLWKNLDRDIDSRLFFFTEWSLWKMGNVSLKVLEFFVHKRVRTLKFAVLPSVKSV